MRLGDLWGFPPNAAFRWGVAGFAILATALVIRLAAASGDLWLDEVVSLNLAQHFTVLEIAAGPGARHDNNHVLNTIYLRAMEESRNALAYRGLSVASGVAGVALMGWIGGRRSRRAGLLAAFLGSFSYILVHYGSEARGYALAAALGLAAWLAVERDLAKPGWAPRAWLGGLVALGYLAHYSFGFVYAGLVCWMALHAVRSHAPWRTRFGTLFAQNGVPLLVTGAVYVGHVRPMHLAGGPEFGVGWALWSGLGESLGFQFHPEASLAARLAPALALGLLATECVLRIRESREDVAFYLGLFGAASMVTIFVIRPEFVVPRYFFVAMPFALILVASLLDRGLGAGGIARVAAGLLVVFLLFGSAVRDLGLVQGGRGHYRDAVEFIADRSGPVALVSGTDPRWVRVLIEGYYAQFRPDVRFDIREIDPAPGARPAQWYLHNTWSRDYQAPEFIEPGAGQFRYRFVRHFPFASLSGWHWYLFRLEP